MPPVVPVLTSGVFAAPSPVLLDRLAQPARNSRGQIEPRRSENCNTPSRRLCSRHALRATTDVAITHLTGSDVAAIRAPAPGNIDLKLFIQGPGLALELIQTQAAML
jgi:hypothetical protein